MISQRVITALNRGKYVELEIRVALAKVIEAAEFLLTCKGTTHVANSGVPALEGAFSELEQALKDVGV